MDQEGGHLRNVIFSYFVTFLLLFLLFPRGGSFRVSFLSIKRKSNVCLYADNKASVFVSNKDASIGRMKGCQVLPFLGTGKISRVSC